MQKSANMSYCIVYHSELITKWKAMNKIICHYLSPFDKNIALLFVTAWSGHVYCKSHDVSGPFILARLAVRPFSLR